MPESNFERLVLVLGLFLLAGLLALIVSGWREYVSGDDPTAGAPRPAALSALPPAASPAPATTEVNRRAGLSPPRNESVAGSTTRSPERKPAKPHVAKLRLVAARGDCWIEARSGSSTGRQLYFGMLGRGKSLTLSGRVLWVRLGAPQNLTGWIGAKPVRNLPGGAATVVATPAGVRTIALG